MTTADPTNATASALYLSDDDRPGVSKGALAIFLGIAAMYIGFRLWDLTGSSLWFDEIFALRIARLPWSELFLTLAADKTTPPLFYAVLKAWIAIGGESLSWLKLLPFAASVLTLVPFFFLCRELRLSGLGMNLALAMMAPNSFLINYSQEVRMYSMLMLFTTCSLWMFVRYVNRPQSRWPDIALLFAANLLLVFTHYFGWLVVGVEAAFLLWLSPRRVVALIAPAVALLVIFLPWAYMVARVAVNEPVPFSNISWIEFPSIRSVSRLLRVMTGPSTFWGNTALRIVLFFGPAAIWVRDHLRHREGRTPDRSVLTMLLALTAAPVVVVFLVSWLGPLSYWYPRYFIIIVVPFMLLVAAGITRLRPFALRSGFAAGVIVFSLFANVSTFEDAEFSRVKWDVMVGEMTASAGTDETITIYAFEMLSHEAVQFYLEEAGAKQVSVTRVDHSSQITDNDFWVVYGPRREADRNNSPVDVLGQRGYRPLTMSTYGRKGFEVLLVRFTK